MGATRTHNRAHPREVHGVDLSPGPLPSLPGSPPGLTGAPTRECGGPGRTEMGCMAKPFLYTGPLLPFLGNMRGPQTPTWAEVGRDFSERPETAVRSGGMGKPKPARGGGGRPTQPPKPPAGHTQQAPLPQPSLLLTHFLLPPGPLGKHCCRAPLKPQLIPPPVGCLKRLAWPACRPLGCEVCVLCSEGVGRKSRYSDGQTGQASTSADPSLRAGSGPDKPGGTPRTLGEGPPMTPPPTPLPSPAPLGQGVTQGHPPALLDQPPEVQTPAQ